MNSRMVFAVSLTMALLFAPGASQARWMNPNTGRFQTMDSFEGSQSDPLSLHRYLYASDNPANRVDHSGLLSYLLLYGEDNTDIFRNSANNRKKEIEAWKGFDPKEDTVLVAQVYTVQEFGSALRTNEDIAYFAYIGHGGPGVLYLGLPSGKDYNLSPNGGPAGAASDSTAVSELPADNVRIDARIELLACDGTTSKPGGMSMARAFADHFQVPVKAAGAGVSFDRNGVPYVGNWRILRAKVHNVFYQDGGAGWSWTLPSLILP